MTICCSSNYVWICSFKKIEAQIWIELLVGVCSPGTKQPIMLHSEKYHSAWMRNPYINKLQIALRMAEHFYCSIFFFFFRFSPTDKHWMYNIYFHAVCASEGGPSLLDCAAEKYHLTNCRVTSNIFPTKFVSFSSFVSIQPFICGFWCYVWILHVWHGLVWWRHNSTYIRPPCCLFTHQISLRGRGCPHFCYCCRNIAIKMVYEYILFIHASIQKCAQ